MEALQEKKPGAGGGRARLPLLVSPLWVIDSDRPVYVPVIVQDVSWFFKALFMDFIETLKEKSQTLLPAASQNVSDADADLLMSLTSVRKPAGVSPIRLEPPPKEEGAPVEQM